MTARVNFLPIYEATEQGPAAAAAAELLKSALVGGEPTERETGRRLSDASGTTDKSSVTTAADSNGREMDLLPIFED